MRNTKNLSQGFFNPRNPHKYDGNHTNIVFRSSWEMAVMKWCDLNPSVLSWSSEEIIVPYYFDVDEKWHRYFVDFKVKIRTTSHGDVIYLIEVKPYDQVQRPKESKARTQKARARYQSECEEWIKNQKKWEAATQYAQERGWKFQVLTERELFPGGKK